MTATFGASVGMIMCIRMVASGWDFCFPPWATCLGYATFGLVSIMPLFNTFLHAGKLKSVGRGTRAEPFVASLLGYGCSLLLTLMNKWEVNESVWINGIGVSINFIYLALFLICADNTNGRWIAPVISVLGATLFFGLTMVVGLLFESIVAVQCLCMLSGLASACAPLIIVLFVVGRYLENLPDCFSSSVGLLYYTVWATFPQQEYFDWIPNATGALLSAGFLYLLFEWRNQHEPAAGQENEPLLNEQNETLIEVIQEGMAPKETAPAVHPEENRAATELPPVENTQDTVMDPEKPAAAVHPEENRAATEQPQVENTQNPVIHPKETAPAVHPEENRAATEQPPVENTKDTVMDPEKPAAAGPLEENLAGTKQPQVENTQDSVDPQQPPVDPQQPVNAQDPADQ